MSFDMHSEYCLVIRRKIGRLTIGEFRVNILAGSVEAYFKVPGVEPCSKVGGQKFPGLTKPKRLLRWCQW